MIVHMNRTVPELEDDGYVFVSDLGGEEIREAFTSGEEVVVHIPAPGDEDPDPGLGWNCETYITILLMYKDNRNVLHMCPDTDLWKTYFGDAMPLNIDFPYFVFDSETDKLKCSIGMPK